MKMKIEIIVENELRLTGIEWTDATGHIVIYSDQQDLDRQQIYTLIETAKKQMRKFQDKNG